MEADLLACDKHGLAEVMPHSGRCRACIEESNAEARPYLAIAHTLAEGCREVQKYLRNAQQSPDPIDEA